jgi:hypothetical protein
VRLQGISYLYLTEAHHAALQDMGRKHNQGALPAVFSFSGFYSHRRKIKVA